MNRINRILLLSFTMTCFSAFAINGPEEQNTSFYFKGLGGGTYSQDIDIKSDKPIKLEDKFEADFSGLVQVGVGVKYEPIRASFEIDYMKPFGNKFTMKDSIGMDVQGLLSNLSNLSNMLNAITSRDEFEQYLHAFNSFAPDPNNKTPAELQDHISSVADKLFLTMDIDKIKKVFTEILKGMQEYVGKKKSVALKTELELEDYHVFVGRANFDIIDKANYSFYVSAGAGFSYFCGNMKINSDYYETHTKIVTFKLKPDFYLVKPDFYLTGLLGLGMGYKINDAISIMAQYDFTFTSEDVTFEPDEKNSKVTIPLETKIDLYNHNFGLGLKIQL